MKSLSGIVIMIVCCLSLLGCNTMNNQDVGTIAGGVAGGLLGSTIGGGTGKVLAVAAGTIAGAYLGGAVGRDMDRNDRMRMDAALENNAVGQPAYWHNAHTGSAYEVVPVRNVNYHGNQYCREYRTVANIGGRKQRMYGTACRQPDGSWRAVS